MSSRANNLELELSEEHPPFNLYNESFQEFFDRDDIREVDLILTDPPYAISRDTGFKQVVDGVQRFAVDMDFGSWDHAKIDVQLMARSMYKSLRKGGTAIVFYDIWKVESLRKAMEIAGFKQIRLIIWEKTNPVPLNSKRNYLTNAREIAVSGVKVGKPTFHSEYDNGVYRYPIPREQRFHPTQKPIKLMSELIAKHSDVNDLVLDCFSGSGTTAAAAFKAGRKFVGCEIDKHYWEKSIERLEKEVPESTVS